MDETAGNTPEAQAHKRVKGFTDLMWHVTTFVIVNGFLWVLDIIQDDALNWAYWVTITWGVGLAFHVAAYLLDENGMQNRKYQRYLAEEQARDHAEN